MKPRLSTWRCTGCGRILARYRPVPGLVLEIKCHCNAMNDLTVLNEEAGAATVRRLLVLASETRN